MDNFIYPYLCGSFDSSFYAFYDYCEKVLKIKYKVHRKWNSYLNLSNYNLIYPFEEFVVFSEKPTNINMHKNVLHNETGPSIKYADGFEVYSLNGVRVPKELVMTKPENLNCKKWLKENNVEIRREFVRKVGIERVCSQLKAKCVDKKGKYELLILDIGDGRKRPYLKMLNPSIGTYHIEGVEPQIKTVEDAIVWRNGTKEEPVILT